METAEEFAIKLVARVWDRMRQDWGAAQQYTEATREVDARDNATRLAAKLEGALEALAEIEARIRHQFRIVPCRDGGEWRQVLPILIRDTRARYQAAEAQPVQGEETR